MSSTHIQECSTRVILQYNLLFSFYFCCSLLSRCRVSDALSCLSISCLSFTRSTLDLARVGSQLVFAFRMVSPLGYDAAPGSLKPAVDAMVRQLRQLAAFEWHRRANSRPPSPHGRGHTPPRGMRSVTPTDPAVAPGSHGTVWLDPLDTDDDDLAGSLAYFSSALATLLSSSPGKPYEHGRDATTARPNVRFALPPEHSFMMTLFLHA